MNKNYLSKQKEIVRELEEAFDRGIWKSTVVKMQKDYANDDQICLTSVAFIPNEISNKIVKDVNDKSKKIEPQHYYYPPDSMHLTIKNIRTINKPALFSEEDIFKVNKLFNEEIPQYPIFEFNVEDVLVFPTSVSIIAYSNDETLQKLNLALDKGLKEIGVPDDKKYFTDSIFWGNITICRFVEKPGDQFISEVKKMRNSKIGSFKVEKINLITSNAVCYPKTRKIVGEYQLR